MRFAFIGTAWVCTLFLLSCRRIGVTRVGEIPLSLLESAPPPPNPGRGRSASRTFPFPCHGFPGSLLCLGRVCRSRQFWACSQPFTLSLPCRTWFARSLVKLSLFFRNFSKPVEPTELRYPAGVVTLVLQGLTRDLYVPFWSSDERFLAQSLLFLLALASTRLTRVLHVLFVLSLSLQC